MRKILFVLIAITVGGVQQAYAGETTGTITKVRVSSQSSTPGNPIHIWIEGTWINKPACAQTGGRLIPTLLPVEVF